MNESKDFLEDVSAVYNDVLADCHDDGFVLDFVHDRHEVADQQLQVLLSGGAGSNSFLDFSVGVSECLEACNDRGLGVLLEVVDGGLEVAQGERTVLPTGLQRVFDVGVCQSVCEPLNEVHKFIARDLILGQVLGLQRVHVEQYESAEVADGLACRLPVSAFEC